MNYPELCYVYVEVGMEIGIIKWGESGYYITNYDGKTEQNIMLVNKLNSQLGITENEAEAMKILSMNTSINGNDKEWKAKFEEIVSRMNERSKEV